MTERCAAWSLGLLVVALAACADDRAHQPVIDLAAVNALVPPALAPTLVFERHGQVLERGPRKTTYTLAAPRGWTQHGEMSVNLRPDGQAPFVARLTVGSNCDGPCTAKPWAAVADRVNFAPRSRGKVFKDVRAPGRRTMIAESARAGIPTTDVVVAWWTDGAHNYHTCTASLGETLKAAAPAFEAACQAVIIDGDD